MRNLYSFVLILLVIGFLSCKGGETVDNNIQPDKAYNIDPQIKDADISDEIKNESSEVKNTPSDASGVNSKINTTDPQSQGNTNANSIDQPNENPEPTAFGEIAFEEVRHDFGRLPQGGKINKKFKFVNKGNAPLNIKRVTASCGCTVPSYPFVAIEPGAEGFIDVEFNSVGKMGVQRQKVTVVTDGKPSRAVLSLNGFVIPKSEGDSSS